MHIERYWIGHCFFPSFFLLFLFPFSELRSYLADRTLHEYYLKAHQNHPIYFNMLYMSVFLSFSLPFFSFFSTGPLYLPQLRNWSTFNSLSIPHFNCFQFRFLYSNGLQQSIQNPWQMVLGLGNVKIMKRFDSMYYFIISFIICWFGFCCLA